MTEETLALAGALSGLVGLKLALLAAHHGRLQAAWTAFRQAGLAGLARTS